MLCAYISTGEAYFGLVSCPDVSVMDDPLEKVGLAGHLKGAEQLADFQARVAQELRRIRPIRVGVVRPRRYSGWVYKEAFARVAPEAAIMLACHDLGIEFHEVRAEDAASALMVPPTALPERAAERLGVKPPRRFWKHRAWAFAGAQYLAGKHCS
jgi:hypothetical protein